MKIKKIACLLMALAMIWMTASCHVDDGNVTELTGSTTATNPGGDTGGVDPGATDPADPGSDGPSKPVDPTTPSDPAPSEPVDPSTPSDPVIPSDPVVTEPGHEHEYTEVVTEATCTEDGFTTYSCECGDVYVGNKVTATGHSWGDWVTTKEPTEDTTGEATRSCANCEEKEVKTLDKVIPNHTHSYTSKVTTAATCTKEGVKTYTCSCGGSYTESIEKIPHSYKATVTKPTCTNKGYTTYKCGSCGDSYKDDYVSAKGHTFGSYKSNGDATCTKDGTKTASCTVCGSKETKTDAGSAKGHSYKASVIAATCAERGYTLHKCSACGDSYKDNYTDKADHDYTVAGTIAATMWAEGFTTYICNNCGNTYESDYVDKIPQKEFERMVAEATVKYINQFRQEQGETEAASLPVLTLIAEERAVQLQGSFKHDSAALRELYNQYQYGEWVDGSFWGGSQYYNGNAMEAIAARSKWRSSPDRVGEALAKQFLNSASHWAYVGSSDYSYIGIGISYNENAASGYCWHCCVLQTSENYG